MTASSTAVPAVQRAGVVGAGTMGAGIAQALAQSGVDVHLVDTDDRAVARAVEQIGRDLRGGVDRGRHTAVDAATTLSRIATGVDMGQLATAQLVIEAVPERLSLKTEVFEQVASICDPDTVLATNTSSLLVSELASATVNSQRVLGLHFFNPVPRMLLVEVVPGLETSPRALAVATATVEAMGKRAVIARDGIGFLVNRCARPFYGEALKLVQEGVATVEQVDRICRMGAGFRMGPFEVVDLIGVDVNFEIAKSFFEQSFGEPRWRPSPLQAKLVAAGRHGRKSGRGFYNYTNGPHRPADPQPLPPGRGGGRSVAILGDGAIPDLLRSRAIASGFIAANDDDSTLPWLITDASIDGLAHAGPRGPRLVLCANSSLRRRPEAGAAGFHVLPLEETRLAELTADDRTDPIASERSRQFLSALGWRVEQVGDAPGLVLGRIAAQLANEASFAVAEGVGTTEDVEAGATLGLNYPRGPFGFRDALGVAHVRAVLDALFDERHEERYRLAPALAT